MIPLRPTTRGIAMILAGIASFAIALVNSNIVTALTTSGIAAIVLASLFLALFSLTQIDLERRPSQDGIQGQPVNLPVLVRNHSKRLRQAVVIRELLPFTKRKSFNVSTAPLLPREKRLVNRMAPTWKRGEFELDTISLLGGDPAGLFVREKRFSFPTKTLIYPDSKRLSWMPIRIREQMRGSSTGRPIGVAGVGEEFFGVREYRPSDGVRFIHWKASAKQGRLMVREFEANSITQITVLLDADISLVGNDLYATNFEYLVSTAASIASYLSGTYCRLLFISPHPHQPEQMLLIDGQAFSVEKQILNALATISPVKIPVSKVFDTALDLIQPNSILYCLSMSNQNTLSDNFELLIERGVDVRWFCAHRNYFPLIIEESNFELPVQEVQLDSCSSVIPYMLRRHHNLSKVLTYG